MRDTRERWLRGEVGGGRQFKICSYLFIIFFVVFFFASINHLFYYSIKVVAVVVVDGRFCFKEEKNILQQDFILSLI